jgi:hypothetical protein
MNYAGMRNVVRVWSAGLLGTTPLIYANQNAPRPNGLFATLRVVALRWEWSSAWRKDNEGNVTTFRGVEGTIEFQFFGPGAISAAYTFASKTGGMLARYGIGTQDVAFIQIVSGPNDLTGLAGSRFEERAQIDVLVRWMDSVTEVAGVIERVAIGGEIIAPESTMDMDLDIDTGEGEEEDE